MQIDATNRSLPSHTQRVPACQELLAAGYAALATNEYYVAETFFRRAIHVDPRSIEAWRALADTQTGARHGICLRWVEYLQTREQRAAPLPHPRPARTYPRYARRSYGRLIGAASAGALILILGSDLIYRDRALPGVRVGAIDIGHLSTEAIVATIEQQYRSAAARLVEVRIGDKRWQTPAGALLLDNVSDLTRAALTYGHDESFWARTTTRMRSFLGQDHLISAPPINRAAVATFVTAIANEIARERRDAQIVHTEQGWIILPEQIGQTIDQQRLTDQLTEQLRNGVWQPQTALPPLAIEMIHEAPQATVAQLEPLHQRLQELSTQPLVVGVGEQHWSLDRSLLMDLTTTIDPAALKPSLTEIDQQLESIAAQVAIPPQPSRLERDGQRVRAIIPAQIGRELDRKAATQAIVTAMTNNAPQVELPIREIRPEPGEVEQLGLIAELGRGESQFLTYSSPERDANVEAGGKDVDGVLIAPGEVFSFTATVGEITWEKGYRWGEMIEAGTVVPSLGGGICQVSTTVFRAAFWSGLDIVERHHHTWRLPWYEVDAPPGMDATIALGGPDLKFRNNTQQYILIKVETDLVAKRQTVIMYGTPDGRKVEMAALNNGNIGVYRSVIDGTQLMDEDTFMSYYTQ